MEAKGFDHFNQKGCVFERRQQWLFITGKQSEDGALNKYVTPVSRSAHSCFCPLDSCLSAAVVSPSSAAGDRPQSAVAHRVQRHRNMDWSHCLIISSMTQRVGTFQIPQVQTVWRRACGSKHLFSCEYLHKNLLRELKCADLPLFRVCALILFQHLQCCLDVCISNFLIISSIHQSVCFTEQEQSSSPHLDLKTIRHFSGFVRKQVTKGPESQTHTWTICHCLWQFEVDVCYNKSVNTGAAGWLWVFMWGCGVLNYLCLLIQCRKKCCAHCPHLPPQKESFSCSCLIFFFAFIRVTQMSFRDQSPVTLRGAWLAYCVSNTVSCVCMTF